VASLADVNKPIAVVAQQRQTSPTHRYCATTVATDRLPVATVSYGPLLQCLFIVVIQQFIDSYMNLIASNL
jgi:hypothetical protein